MSRFDDDQPKFAFHPQWKHLFHLIDLAVLVGLFFLGAYLFRTWVGEKKLAALDLERQTSREAAVRGQAQADSIKAYEQDRLKFALADSTAEAGELARRRTLLDETVAEQQRVNAGLNPLMDQLLDIQYRATKATNDVRQYREDIAARRTTINGLQADALRAGRELDEAQARNEAVSARLAQARDLRTHEPKGVLPDQAGVVVRQDIASSNAFTNFAYQHNLWSSRVVDVGVQLGVGLSSDVASSKEVGVFVTRPLVHRRLGLDFGAGYSMFSQSGSDDETGAYASAALRLSPFFQERFHVGLGARAVQADEEVTPFISVGLGRR